MYDGLGLFLHIAYCIILQYGLRAHNLIAVASRSAAAALGGRAGGGKVGAALVHVSPALP